MNDQVSPIMEFQNYYSFHDFCLTDVEIITFDIYGTKEKCCKEYDVLGKSWYMLSEK